MVKFLIIRFSSIGDIVLTSPVIRCLKNQVEGAEIHFLTKEKYLPVIMHNPYISKFHLLKDKLNDTLKELQDENFDYIIDLHHNLRSARVKMKLKRVDFSFNKLNIEKWLLVHLKINKLPPLHIVDRYMDTVQIFDVANDKQGLEYFITEKDENFDVDLPAGFEKGFVALSIGGQHTTKKMPADRLAFICNKISFPVVLLGGSEDFKEAVEIIKQTGDQCFNACGKYTLNQSAGILKHSRLVITHDTGLMHIASAFKKNVISLWGNTIPEFGMSPYRAGELSRIFEVKGLKCRPCSKLGFKTCPKNHFKCMMDQNIEEISQYCTYVLNS